MGKKQTSQIPNILLSVKDASVAISVSTKMVRLLIASGRLKAVNLGKRMTRISLQELTDFAGNHSRLSWDSRAMCALSV